MAAYAALVSVMHIIDNLQTHCRPPISLHKEQVNLLSQKVTFLQEFLEVYNPNLPYSKEADPLESRIARAAYAAEDAIESHILDHFTNNNGEKMRSDGLYEALEKVIEEMALIGTMAEETLEFKNRLHTKSTAPADFSRSFSSIVQENRRMVGADDLLYELQIKLIDDARDLQTIPIVGMGGSDAPNVQDGIVLENLQSLATIRDFTCNERVVKRVPNIRKLKIVYREGVDERFCLTNLDCLQKLESLNCIFNESMCQMSYPQSLKKLNLEVHVSQCWQDILDKIGALPLLEKLSLHKGTFKGQWETTEGQFCSLKFLSLNWCQGLQVWASEASHFPILKQLHLYGLDDLEEIPLKFSDLLLLRLVVLERCSDSAVESAKIILEEQEELYGEATLQVHVMLSEDNDPALESLSTPNFHVTLLLF